MRVAFLLLLAGCGTEAVTEVTDPASDRIIGHDPGKDTGRDTAADSGDTADSAKDSADSGKDTADSGADTADTSADTAADTSADTADTAVDTGTSPVDTADTAADTGTSPVDTVDSGVDTGVVDTGPFPVDTADTSVDTGTSPVDTADSGSDSGLVDTGTSPVDTADSGSDSGPIDTGTSPADTGVFDTGTPLVDTGAVDTGTPFDTSLVDTVDSGTDSGGIVVVIGPGDTADTADTAAPLDTSTVDTSVVDTSVVDTSLVDTATVDTSTPVDTATETGGGGNNPGGGKETGLVDTAAPDTDTSVYFPDSCDTADTAGCSDVIRFVALGDAGTGDRRQTQVASAIEAVCALDGCDFALYLGDNIYGSGPTDVTDVQWSTKFEIPYSGLGFYFYSVLGNHDYGGFYDTATAAVEVAYTAYSSKWYMPTRFYTETLGDLSVIALDTQSMQLGHGADQESWIPGAASGISTTWTIAIGHHPYVSNGPHGNAGEFDGNPGEGIAMKDFFDAYICGTADVYLAGHDHALQWLERPAGCDTEMIVAGGGGAGTYPIVGSNAAYYEDSSNGFLWVELDGNQFTGVFYDETGAEVYRRTFTK